MKIAVLDDYQAQAHRFADWQQLPEHMQVDFFHQPLTGETLINSLQGYEVIIAMRERTAFPADVLQQLADLKLLVTTGMRNAAIDLHACTRQGITVCGTGVVGAPAAELTWALILALFKKLVHEDRALHRGQWQTGLSQTLEGKVLGVIGLGKLGSKVARIAQAFGMQVLAWSPNLDAARAAAAGVQLVSKQALFTRSDVVSLHLVLSERTQGVIGADELALMKPTAYLVNTARAGLVDQNALLHALQQQQIAGAGLDVFAQEPLPADHPYLQLDNLVLTPHLGYATEENFTVYYQDAVADILAWLQHQPIRVLNE